MKAAILFLCILVCLVQNVFGQSLNKYGLNAAVSPGLGLSFPPGLAPGYSYPPGMGGFDVGAYGGTGEGNVIVAGDLPVAGTTTVTGQVPIMGAVTFGGDVLAGGAVSITGNCACGCGAPYMY